MTAVDFKNTVAHARTFSALKIDRATGAGYVTRVAVGNDFTIASIENVTQSHGTRRVQIATVEWLRIDVYFTVTAELASIAHIEVADVGVVVFRPFVNGNFGIAPSARIVALVFVKFIASVVNITESR